MLSILELERMTLRYSHGHILYRRTDTGSDRGLRKLLSRHLGDYEEDGFGR
jgi:hypothetical protein